jgi:hypothetical protein
MSGAGGQKTMIIPSHDLVVVRLGHFKGRERGDEELQESARAADGGRAGGEVDRGIGRLLALRVQELKSENQV